LELEEEEPTMNKRSAMLVAAGLVLTLIVGGVAIAVGMTGPSSSAASPKTVKQHKKQKPIIKTVRRTITVHKKAPAAAVAAPVYAASSGTAPSTSSGYASSNTGSGSGSSYGDDGGHDDGHDSGFGDDGGSAGGSYGGGDD
jgi:hypothetical protein